MNLDAHQMALADAIAERVASILQRLDGPSARDTRRKLPQADMDALTVLLPAIWAECGVQVLAVADLVERARASSALRDAIERATGRPCHQAGVVLGRLLLRAVGVDVGELQIHRVGTSRGVALWQLGFTPKANEGF